MSSSQHSARLCPNKVLTDSLERLNPTDVLCLYPPDGKSHQISNTGSLFFKNKRKNGPWAQCSLRAQLRLLSAQDAGCSRSHFKMLYFSLGTYGKHQHLIKFCIHSKT